ncbi:hypothetical protein GTW69_06855 [Streptomyces sp. SID7760]|nr:hypothetical protein [Streptomyces sp. SID7760]
MDLVATSALVVSGLGLIASGFAVNYSRKQAHSSGQQAQAAREQVVAAQQQVRAAQEQVGAANRQVDAAMRQVEIAERAHREAAEPYVVVDIRPRTPGSELLTLTIENIGSTLARAVQIAISPPLRSSLGSEHERGLAAVLSQPIAHLPPRSVLKYTLDTGSGLFGDESIPRVYSVSVEAEGPYGPVGTLNYVIDLNVISHMVLDRESIEWSTKRLADESRKQTELQRKQLREVVKMVARTNSLAGGRSSAPEPDRDEECD